MEYAANRIFRIYPALIVCAILSLASAFAVGYMSSVKLNLLEFLGWVVGQISFFQFYNPEFMREFGTGVLNGSLWTITVELQFYLIIPLIYLLFGQKNSRLNIILVLLILFFIVVNQLSVYFEPQYGELILFKLFRISFAPWLYMFLIGVLFQNNFKLVHKYLSKNA